MTLDKLVGRMFHLHMRIPTPAEYDDMLRLGRRDDDVIHLGMASFVQDIRNRYKLPKGQCAYRIYNRSDMWASMGQDEHAAHVGFRPVITHLPNDLLIPSFKDGQIVVVGTLLMDSVPVKVPQGPTRTEDITRYTPGVKLKMVPPLDDPEYMVQGIRRKDVVYADRVLIRDISYREIEDAIIP